MSKRIIKLTESDLTKIVRQVIRETEEASSTLNSLNQELMSSGLPTISMDDLQKNVLPTEWDQLDDKLDNEELPDEDEVDSTLSQLETAICKATPEQLHQAKKQIIQIIKSKLNKVVSAIKGVFGGKQTSVNEQLTGVVTILGVSAPVWAIAALGAILLYLIVAAIVEASSQGYGCTGRSKYITGYKRSKTGGFSGRKHGESRRRKRYFRNRGR